MRVLFINVDCGIGSTGRICVDLAKELIKQGNEAIIAYGRECSKSDKNISHRIGNDFDIYLHGLHSRLFDRSGFSSTRVTKKFIKWIREFNPDIISLHNLHGYWINIEILFKFLKDYGKPITWTLHDCWAFTGHCAYFDYVNCDKWKTCCYACPQLKTYPKSILFDNSERNYKEKKNIFMGLNNLTLITPSKWLANLVKQSFLGNNKVVVIPNGIDTSVFYRHNNTDFKTSHGISTDKKIILGVASPWSKRKGFDDFVALSKIISNDFVIVMIGLSKKQLDILPSNIIGLQKTSSVYDLVDLYSSAFVLFNPTYEDNYPTVNLEAQACGLPVISYNTGGSVESCPLNQVVEQGDLNTVLSILRNISLTIEKQDFAKSTMSTKYLKLFEETLNYSKYDT